MNELVQINSTSTTFVVSYEELWMWIINFVYYLDAHNQTSDTDQGPMLYKTFYL